MKARILFSVLAIIVICTQISFREGNGNDAYINTFNNTMVRYEAALKGLCAAAQQADLSDTAVLEALKANIAAARIQLKAGDFWYRYLEPTTYKKLNGPLPVEWETEVFEKFERPYRREGAGLTLAALYLDEPQPKRDTLLSLLHASIRSLEVYRADSITKHLGAYHHFFLCNRLFLLNLASIYTTGFECPDTTQIIPELRLMLANTQRIYTAYNESFPATALPEAYLQLYSRAIRFCETQPAFYSGFDHFTFIRDYVNPLYALNQQLVNEYRVVSRSMADYALNKTSTSIFSKDIYNGQNSKGIFLRVKDSTVLAEIDRVGKMLFYDPILSGNNMRSCASCHKPTAYFTDTMTATHLAFNRKDHLPRNTPSLINAGFNHLVMADGQHFTLQHQTKAVITNAAEMACSEADVIRKVLSCAEYKAAFTRLLTYTPQEPQITLDHIASAITYYYGKFSRAAAPFDLAMNKQADADPEVIHGFNLFMSKAQCGTCHFVPLFNGVKPPFVGSEFEVLGVPADTGFHRLSTDQGRYGVNPATETMNAFRTGSVRNTAYTAPYMHNGVFKELSQVIDFYDHGGGAGRGLQVPNQTLSADSLHLSRQDKHALLRFIGSLNENIHFEQAPVKLPVSSIARLNKRKVGGIY